MLIQTYYEPITWKPGKNIVPYKLLGKEEAHKQGLLHLSAHLLIQDEGRFCVRKRGLDELRYSSLLTTTLATHVLPGDNYLQSLQKLLTPNFELEWIGEFRVKDEFENEINGLYLARNIEINYLEESFFQNRSFLDLEEILLEISQDKTTPHLKKAIKLLNQIKSLRRKNG